MFLAVVAERHDRDVGLGLGFVVRDERQLDADDGFAQKRRRQNHVQPINRTGVSGIVGAHVHQHSVKELNALVLESAERDEAVILRAFERARTLRQKQRIVEHA